MTPGPSGPPLAFFNPAAFAFDDEVAIALIADLQIRKAIERGEFEDLPGLGEPIDLPDQHDPDWWLRKLMQRERIALLPPSIQLRKDDAALDERLDELWTEDDVRHELEQFNERVISARYQLPEGPPLITMPRDVDATVRAWAGRKAMRAARARDDAARQRVLDAASAPGSSGGRGHWSSPGRRGRHGRRGTRHGRRRLFGRSRSTGES